MRLAQAYTTVIGPASGSYPGAAISGLEWKTCRFFHHRFASNSRFGGLNRAIYLQIFKGCIENVQIAQLARKISSAQIVSLEFTSKTG